jgi:hypothetical protein
LLDQFLSENKRQLETKKRMEDPFNGRKIKWNLALTLKTSSHTVHLSYH